MKRLSVGAVVAFLFLGGTGGCDLISPPPSLEIDAPASLRQGEVTALEVRRDGAPVSAVSWTVEPAGGGEVIGDRFVAYNPGEVRLTARSEELEETVEITVQARGAAAITFTEVGRGQVSERFTSDLWIHGGFGYTGTWGIRAAEPTENQGDMLKVWSLADPQQPQLVDEVVVDAFTINDVKVSADGALGVITHEHSADGLNGITLLDLSQPGSPTVLSRHTDGLTGGVHNVWIDQGHVYAASPHSGLVVVDISDPVQPTNVATFSIPGGFLHDVLVRDGLAFVSYWESGLVILDVGHGIRGGSPSNPVEVSRVATAGGQTHNAWYWPAGGYVFVGEEDFGTPGKLHVVDVSDLTDPREVATFLVPGSTPHNFWMDETREVLYAAWYAAGLRAIDVSGELLGRLERQGREVGATTYGGPAGGCPGGTGTCTWAPQLANGLLYLSDLNQGLIVFSYDD